MHERLIEAEKQLARAKDHYAHAIAQIDAQHVKPVAGAGEELEACAEIRSRYFTFNAEAAVDPSVASEPDPPPAALVRKPRKKKNKGE